MFPCLALCSALLWQLGGACMLPSLALCLLVLLLPSSLGLTVLAMMAVGVSSEVNDYLLVTRSVHPAAFRPPSLDSNPNPNPTLPPMQCPACLPPACHPHSDPCRLSSLGFVGGPHSAAD